LQLPLEPDYTSKFYIRIKIRDQLGVIRVVGELAERHQVQHHDDDDEEEEEEEEE
jgi:Cdc6-like AAA superfamily ATPase